MTDLTRAQTALLDALKAEFPDVDAYRRSDIISTVAKIGGKRGTASSLMKRMDNVGYGKYSMSAQVVPLAPTHAAAPGSVPQEAKPVERKVVSVSNDEVFVPEKLKTFVKWGHFADVSQIIKSRMFYPVYVTGLSGNGKTMMIEQACAEANREYVRVQITPETDEDDLIGGFRLVNGETVFAKGPVIKAMEAGAILLVDEIDRGSNKLMAMQGVLEGKPVLIKKTGEVIRPAPGFNVIATANTKGKGSEDGRFIAATIVDEAFLERFTITLEQPYPEAKVEKKIVMKHMELFNCVDDNFADILVKWGTAIRKTFEDGGVDEIISTRRICHIVQTFSIFNNRKKAVQMCVSRFDDDTKAAFVDLYEKIDSEATVTPTSFTGNDFVDVADDYTVSVSSNPF